MLWIWRYLTGYITIKICGEDCEQIINRAASYGVCIWNLHYKAGAIYGNISASNFIKLREIKHGTKCRISIIGKYGFVFRLKKYKKRVGFAVGTAMFLAILIFLSNFVWIIKIEGNKNLSDEEIIASCKKIGIYEGILKNKVNNKYAVQLLQLENSSIAWCSLNVEGSILTVNISEVTESDKNERITPSNLKAGIDGKIKKIDVTSGEVLVKVGDTVSKGELLVSGVTQNMSSKLFVHSEGEIIAETTRVFSAEGEFLQKHNIETGEVTKRYTLNFFGAELPMYLGNIKKQYNYYKHINYLKLFGKPIPIKIGCEEYKITEEKTITYDESTLEEILYDNIKQQVNNFDFINVVECEKEIIYTDKGMLLKIQYKCEENIARQDKILLNT